MLFSILKSDCWPQYERTLRRHPIEAGTLACTNTYTLHSIQVVICKHCKQCSNALQVIIGVTKTGSQHIKKKERKKVKSWHFSCLQLPLVPFQWCNDENMTSVTACANYAALLWTAHWWQWFLADLLLPFTVQTYLVQPKMFMKLR